MQCIYNCMLLKLCTFVQYYTIHHFFTKVLLLLPMDFFFKAIESFKFIQHKCWQSEDMKEPCFFLKGQGHTCILNFYMHPSKYLAYQDDVWSKRNMPLSKCTVHPYLPLFVVFTKKLGHGDVYYTYYTRSSLNVYIFSSCHLGTLIYFVITVPALVSNWMYMYINMFMSIEIDKLTFDRNLSLQSNNALKQFMFRW